MVVGISDVVAGGGGTVVGSSGAVVMVNNTNGTHSSVSAPKQVFYYLTLAYVLTFGHPAQLKQIKNQIFIQVMLFH